MTPDAPEIVRLREDLAVNAQMLARQCDLARQAEHECSRLKARLAQHEQDIEEAYKAGWVDRVSTGPDYPRLMASAVARFKASRKGGSDDNG